MARRTEVSSRRSDSYADRDLIFAVLANDYPLVATLLDSSMPQVQLDRALVAAVHADLLIQRLLLENGADPNFEEGKALNIAVRRKDHPTVLMLVAHGADADLVSTGQMLESARRATLGMASTLMATRAHISDDDRGFVEMLVELHSEQKFFSGKAPQYLELDARKRDLMCDAITGCLMRGEENKVRQLVQAYIDNPYALNALLECVEARDHLSAAFGRIRKLIQGALDRLTAPES